MYGKVSGWGVANRILVLPQPVLDAPPRLTDARCAAGQGDLIDHLLLEGTEHRFMMLATHNFGFFLERSEAAQILPRFLVVLSTM